VNAELAERAGRALDERREEPPADVDGAGAPARRPGARRPGLAWRASYILRRWIAFAYYGLAGLAIAWVVLPLQAVRARLAGRAEPTDLRAQRAIHRASCGLVRLGEGLGIIRVRWRGLERLERRPTLIVANHPSLIDTPILASHLPQVDLIVNPDWSESFFFRGATAAADYVRMDRAAEVVRRTADRLRAGRWVAIYPEGSRTPPEGLRPFHRGAAHVALAAGVDVLPVVIRVTPRTLMKGQGWSHVPERTPEWIVEVGEPIRPADHLDGDESRPVAARRLTAILQAHFEKRWSGQDD